ncbi:hypothetical protein AAG747_22795 [Rapidithrix thailandica]|uniref:TlpA family protein disulfide reductase n=1 Tax=Rapidithrix thailandica TaxID=413964 RepID=A0AAW9S0S3_9BACT
MHTRYQEGVFEEEKSFLETYKVSSFPSYIFIDQEGKLVTLNASRPSSGEVPAAIEKLLKGVPPEGI